MRRFFGDPNGVLTNDVKRCMLMVIRYNKSNLRRVGTLSV